MHKIKTISIALVILGVGMVTVGVIASSLYLPVSRNYPGPRQQDYPHWYLGQQLASYGITILLLGFLILLLGVLMRFLFHLQMNEG